MQLSPSPILSEGEAKCSRNFDFPPRSAAEVSHIVIRVRSIASLYFNEQLSLSIFRVLMSVGNGNGLCMYRYGSLSVPFCVLILLNT